MKMWVAPNELCIQIWGPQFFCLAIVTLKLREQNISMKEDHNAGDFGK